MNSSRSQELFEGATCELVSVVSPQTHRDAQVAEIAPELIDGGNSGSVPAARDDDWPARQTVRHDEEGFPRYREVVCRHSLKGEGGVVVLPVLLLLLIGKQCLAGVASAYDISNVGIKCLARRLSAAHDSWWPRPDDGCHTGAVRPTCTAPLGLRHANRRARGLRRSRAHAEFPE